MNATELLQQIESNPELKAMIEKTYRQTAQTVPVVARDGHGAELKAGDPITIQGVVTAVHSRPDGGTNVNIDIKLPDGRLLHFATCDSTWVTRAAV